MMTLQEIKDALADRNLRVVAVKSGINYNTLLDIRRNPETNPTNKTMAKLSAYLRGAL